MNKKIIFSWLFSLILIVAVLSMIEVEKVVEEIFKIGLINFIFLCGLYSIGYFFRALRWRSILYPITKISVKDSFFITNIGFFVNALLPARTGEFARAYLLSKKKKIGKIKSFSTVALDRIIDGLTLVLFFILSVLFIEIPLEFKTILVAPILIFLLGFLFFIKPDKFRFVGRIITKFFPSIKGKLKYVFQEIKEGGNIFHSEKKQLFLMFFYSVLIWAVEVFVFYFTAQFLGLELNLFHILFLIVVVGFALMVPSAPSYIGTFEASFILSFMALSLRTESAIIMAITLHTIQFLVIITMGAISLNFLGISLKELKFNIKV